MFIFLKFDYSATMVNTIYISYKYFRGYKTKI